MDDSLLLFSASLAVAEWSIGDQQLRDALARMSARLDQVEAENLALRRQVAELRCEVGYWKSRHADALRRIQERDVLIEQQQAEVKQLKSRQFGRQFEKSSARSPDRSNTLPGEADVAPQTARKRGRQPGQKAPQRRSYEHLPVVEEWITLSPEHCCCPKCGAPRIAHGTEAIGYRLDPTRSHNVPEQHFASDALRRSGSQKLLRFDLRLERHVGRSDVLDHRHTEPSRIESA